MGVLILTGPSAAGKNTVGRLLAALRERCVLIDVDVVRHMSVRPEQVPNAAFVELIRAGALPGVPSDAYEADDWHTGMRAVAALARAYSDAGYDVIILDVLSEASARMLRSELTDVRIALLLPSHEEMWRRFEERAEAEGHRRLE